MADVPRRFEIDQVGLAAAIATALTVIIAVVAIAISRFSRRARMIASRLDRFTTYVVLWRSRATALYPLISILFLAFHKKTDLVTGFSLPDDVQPADVHRRLERGQLRARACGAASWWPSR